MPEFVEMLAAETGLPIGIKSAVGELEFWQELARKMAVGGYGVDCITIDGGEGGAGAAPLVFADHVALPFKVGFARVYKVFAEAGVHEDVLFIGSGKLGFPETALWAVAMGCDLINVGREAMLLIGCIQAQRSRRLRLSPRMGCLFSERASSAPRFDGLARTAARMRPRKHYNGKARLRA